MAKKLSKQEKIFCDLYIKLRDVVQCKLELGYSLDINKKKFRSYIQSQPIKLAFEVPDDPILRRLYAIATFDELSMYDEDGDVKPLKSLTDEQRMAINRYKEHSNGTVTFSSYNRHQALETLMRHKGLFKKDNEQTKPDINMNVTLSAKEVKKINETLENDY